MVTRGSGASFDSGFASYGEDSATIRAEIQQDLRREILTALGSRPFARSEGFGIESLENEIVSPESEVLIAFTMASAVGKYNDKVSADRQVITSQELITFDRTPRGSLTIRLYYYLAEDFNVTAPEVQLLEITPGG